MYEVADRTWPSAFHKASILCRRFRKHRAIASAMIRSSWARRFHVGKSARRMHMCVPLARGCGEVELGDPMAVPQASQG